MMDAKSRGLSIGLMLCVSLALASCERSKAVVAAPAHASAQAAPKAAPKVAKIVFVGKEHACDCTRKTVEAGWTVLQKALGTPPKLPVERLQIDTQGDQVAPYRSLRPLMALPAIYFIDGKGGIVELLQGEVEEAQIAAVLKG